MNNADIEVTRHNINPTNGVYYTYKWIGSKYSPVEISDEIDISVLPWKLKLIDRFPHKRSALYMRKEFLIFTFPYEIKKIFMFIYYRVISTLMVWGLAYTPEGCVPSWKDIGKKP